MHLSWLEQGRIAIAAVCDGMGGHAAGEIAAATAMGRYLSGTLSSALGCWAAQEAPNMLCNVRIAFESANEAVIARAKKDCDLSDMGTTLTACVALNNDLYVASVGDSRAYLYRDSSLDRLTRDDSVVQCLVEEGFLSPEEAEWHPRSNEITRAIGTPGDVDGLVITAHPIRPGDVVLCCTDGLWKRGERDITSAFSLLSSLDFTQSNLDETVTILMEEALRRADDNIGISVLWLGPRELSSMAN